MEEEAERAMHQVEGQGGGSGGVLGVERDALGAAPKAGGGLGVDGLRRHLVAQTKQASKKNKTRSKKKGGGGTRSKGVEFKD